MRLCPKSFIGCPAIPVPVEGWQFVTPPQDFASVSEINESIDPVSMRTDTGNPFSCASTSGTMCPLYVINPTEGYKGNTIGKDADGNCGNVTVMSDGSKKSICIGGAVATKMSGYTLSDVFNCGIDGASRRLGFSIFREAGATRSCSDIVVCGSAFSSRKIPRSANCSCHCSYNGGGSSSLISPSTSSEEGGAGGSSRVRLIRTICESDFCRFKSMRFNRCIRRRDC